MKKVPETSAGQAEASEGYVLLDGPDGVTVAMTANAARQTGDNLRRAADEADRQRADGSD